MATSEGIPSSIDIEFLELNDNPYTTKISPHIDVAIPSDKPNKDMNNSHPADIYRCNIFFRVFQVFEVRNNER